MKKIILFSILLAAGLQATLFAQNNVTVQSLQGTHVDTILKYHLAGEGVELSNGRFNNAAGNVTSNQIGSFNRNNYTQFPFETGLVMTTGACSIAAGPNSSGAASSTANNTYHDALLQQYNQGYTVQNSAALDFDFLAYADTFAFHYIFGSEEYPTYVCASYNDLFIFLLTGPDPVTGITTTRNVAVIPGTVS
ncbi:MAG: choice-of-anchor L domain-containing protein, partial [Bacteroidales bacterium]|nr:choice-of-anchor L domain-containing protein [Bacteroidales bacterium]